MDTKKMQIAMRKIAADRQWEQFHAPKNLVMALSSEVGELTELFQWLDNPKPETIMRGKKATAIEDELGDIVYYLLRIADRLNVDLEQAFWRKLEKSLEKYPIALSKGNAKKYTELERP